MHSPFKKGNFLLTLSSKIAIKEFRKNKKAFKNMKLFNKIKMLKEILRGGVLLALKQAFKTTPFGG